MDYKKTIAVVPARLGSSRVKCKNLRLLGGRPLMSYILETLKTCRSFDEIYVNSDSELFAQIARRHGVKFYQRPPEFGTSKSPIDEYIYDFAKNIRPEILAVVNPTSPFMPASELGRAVDYFKANDFDTLLSCEKIQTHCFYKGEPINFSIQGKHPRSQDLEPVRALNFAITLWRGKKYVEHYEKKGYGVYTGKLGFFDIEGRAAIDIDYEEDFLKAEIALEIMKRETETKPKIKYDPILDEVIAGNIRTEN